MDHSDDTNAAIWQSGEAVQAWAAQAQAQEQYRAGHRRFMADLLPFGPQEAFTFLDLGAGTGAASRTILDLHPGSTAILADFSAEMMRAGEREMQPYSGRYRYVEFDMSAGGQWPAAIPSARVNDRNHPEAASERLHRTHLEQARWDNHVRYIIPLGPQLDYLRSAGFEGVDVYWKQLENVIYGGRRPV